MSRCTFGKWHFSLFTEIRFRSVFVLYLLLLIELKITYVYSKQELADRWIGIVLLHLIDCKMIH